MHGTNVDCMYQQKSFYSSAVKMVKSSLLMVGTAIILHLTLHMTWYIACTNKTRE